MSREFAAAMDAYHTSNATRWRKLPSSRRYAEVRVDDVLYVYLHEIDVDGSDLHIQTQAASIPKSWWDNWPSDATVRRYLHQQLDLGGTRITTLEA